MCIEHSFPPPISNTTGQLMVPAWSKFRMIGGTIDRPPGQLRRLKKRARKMIGVNASRIRWRPLGLGRAVLGGKRPERKAPAVPELTRTLMMT
jgi:hypothetical protein